jgi:uncharacterized protein YfiM (DUF2279 family)
MSATLVPTTLTVTVAAQTFPAGTNAVDHIVVSATGSASGNTTPVTQNVPAQTAAGSVTVSFSLQADTYTLSAQAVDVNGNPIGTAATGSLVVSAPATVTLIVPTAIS